ncbi:haloacid dehalogenase [Prauserella marina]|uniref:Haloacid dehalogenase superfamily, subfamily IA, variant 3 with third motif having DD or ED/beta-phosphoglucomutase family hydrolase n=1 Tax=Prauserella marina TaxID=530584 RepID=A0A222VSR1_9PSEU|nr:HAD-IA family hydrolase [Prauserella marina]ASR36761.1 haloacid dehalogenase [Prauserella marina]PWV80346.1 HAD superfamily hydrolase (TIGR01509 family)/beta-phosphoglucomutase family hydrolase [Prauserella marina]SDD52300.1 haloacid dehalogenase superfamily, subfamily IA, variant 3 with third motif having DD or ED/beta-phosphoglucomutase family hydrolase [Prauserella marina]
MTTAPPGTPALTGFGALLLDLDGVLTPTAEVHMRAWARLFTPLLMEKGAAGYTDADYFDHIDGKARYDGVRALLTSRGITLPEGDSADPAEAETVHGLGNRKNDLFFAEIEENGVTPYPGSLAFLDAAVEAGLLVAVVSSSRNAVAVLEAAGIRHRFGIVVDGMVAAREGLPGKPAPDTYLAAAARLGLAAGACVVVEDAQSGVEAGSAGSFGLVVGVDRGAGKQTLRAAGADVVVDDLAELVPAFAPAHLHSQPDSAAL